MKSSLASDLVQAEAAGMNGDELFGRLYYELGALAIDWAMASSARARSGAARSCADASARTR
jgi:hypothetical protein